MWGQSTVIHNVVTSGYRSVQLVNMANMGMPKGQKVVLTELRRRRLEAWRLLSQGMAQVDVARRLKVSRQTMSRWGKLSEVQLAKVQRAGRKGRLGAAGKAWLKAALLRGAKAHGFATDRWTLPRVAALLETHRGVHYSTVHAWRLMHELGFPSRPPRMNVNPPPAPSSDPPTEPRIIQ
jgi:transposase